MRPRQDEVHSWLQGRAPVGEPIHFQYREAMADLGFASKSRLHGTIGKLVSRGLVAKRGRAIVVLRRLEDVYAGQPA